MASKFLVTLAICLLPQRSGAITFESDDVKVFDKCALETVAIEWPYTKAAGEEVEYVKWSFKSTAGGNPKLLAVRSQDQFYAKDLRVTQIGNAGISIPYLQPADAGIVTMELKYTGKWAHTDEDGKNTTTTFERKITREAVIKVSSEPRVASDQLQLRLDITPYRSSSGTYSATLRCGTFSQRGQPPVSPSIEFPNGSTVEVQDYANSEYILPLDAATFRAGLYECILPRTRCSTRDVKTTSVRISDSDLMVFKLTSLIDQLRDEQSVAKQESKGTKQEIEVTHELVKQTELRLNNTNKVLEETRKDLTTLEHTLDRTLEEIVKVGPPVHETQPGDTDTNGELVKTSGGVVNTSEIYISLKNALTRIVVLRKDHERATVRLGNKINETETNLEQYKESSKDLLERRCETGEVITVFNGRYRGIKQIAFRRPFPFKPAVTASFSTIDYEYTINLRAYINILNVTTSGFALEAFKWADSLCHTLKAFWMAC